MCKAKEYSDQLINVFDKLETEYNYLQKENSKTDLMIQDLLHKIEFDDFNAAEGYYLAKQIKDIRIERRSIKNEYETMTSLVMQIKPAINSVKLAKKNIINLESKQVKRTYSPRVLKESTV